MHKKYTPTSEGQEILLKPQCKNFGACLNLGGLQAPIKQPKWTQPQWAQPRWANLIPPNSNMLGWNHFAHLQADSEV